MKVGEDLGDAMLNGAQESAGVGDVAIRNEKSCVFEYGLLLVMPEVLDWRETGCDSVLFMATAFLINK